MISGANEEELELAGARMDIMLATNYTTENPGPLAIIDKYHDKEIERLTAESTEWESKCYKYQDIIDKLEKFFKYEFDNEVRPLNDRKISVWTICLDKLKELKEGK